jgi:hypothetical protein
MKTAIVRLLLASMLAACSGDDSTATDSGIDATQGDASNDVVTTPDAGSDAPVVKGDACVPIEGGLSCDPAHIACGSASCTVGKQVCCIADGGAKETCTNLGANICPGLTKSNCDEAADCDGGNVCCGFVGPTGGFNTACQPSCGTGLQFCHGTAECVTGTCTLMQCRGVTVETCGSFCP